MKRLLACFLLSVAASAAVAAPTPVNELWLGPLDGTVNEVKSPSGQSPFAVGDTMTFGGLFDSGARSTSPGQFSNVIDWGHLIIGRYGISGVVLPPTDQNLRLELLQSDLLISGDEAILTARFGSSVINDPEFDFVSMTLTFTDRTGTAFPTTDLAAIADALSRAQFDFDLLLHHGGTGCDCTALSGSNDPQTAVSEPASLPLIGAALALAAVGRRRAARRV